MKKASSIKPPLKILIIRLSSIGDIILTTPIIRVLKQKFPNCTIDFLIKKQFSELVDYHPFINNVYKFDSQNKKFSLRKIKDKIVQENYDLIVDLHKNFRSYYLSIGSGAKKIVRYKKFIFRRFLLIKFKLNLFKKIIPVYKRYFLSLLQLNIFYDKLGLEVFFDDSIKQKINNKYAAFLKNKDQKILGIAPGASFFTKRWKAEGFEYVINHFIENHNLKIILFGNGSDRELITSLNIRYTHKILNSAGELSLSETGVLMDHCDLFLTNDSGLLHLACALKKKVVAIFGNTTEELGFFPLTTDKIIIENKNLLCRPCSHIGRDSCPKNHFKCMKDIKPDTVIAAVEKLLSKN